MVQCASPQNYWLINCNITRLCSPTVCPQCAEIALHVNKMAPAVPFSPHQQSQHCPDIHYENTKLRSSTVKIFMEMPSSGQVLSRYLWKCQAQVKYCLVVYENARHTTPQGKHCPDIYGNARHTPLEPKSCLRWTRKSRPLINKVSGLTLIKTSML